MIESGFKNTASEIAGAIAGDMLAMKKARVMAVRETVKWASTRIRRGAAAALAIPQKNIGRRVRTRRVDQGDAVGGLWVGTFRVSPFSIGAPRQTRAGVSSGRRRWPGAFIGDLGRRPGVYERKGKRRFPLRRVMIEIERSVVEAAGAIGEAEQAAEFDKKLTQAINFTTK